MKILLEPNLQKEKAAGLTRRAAALLQGYGAVCLLKDSLQRTLFIEGAEYLPREKAQASCDMVITIGGDGTLLHAAAHLLKDPKPLLGINVGRLGFLTSLEESELERLAALATGDYTIENRRFLQAVIPQTGQTAYALNEFVIGACGVMKALRFAVFCDGVKVNDYRGDGVIAATPTGSTAYSLSAGGPIVDGELNAMIVTPVCAHSLNTPPLVLSGDRKLSVHLMELPPDTQVMLAADGGRWLAVTEQETVEIFLSDKSLPLVSLYGNRQLKAIDQKLKGR
ncbi:MAG: NAD(+)/NADH kinase [Oscillospiraceae bacterium]|nr:NAD(+)/NADH kinase [Oscillospiraceae bacterium]